MKEERFETRVVKIVVCPVGSPLFEETCTYVTLEDEAAGEFFSISQIDHNGKNNELRFTFGEEWNALKEAVNQLQKTAR